MIKSNNTKRTAGIGLLLLLFIFSILAAACGRAAADKAPADSTETAAAQEAPAPAAETADEALSAELAGPAFLDPAAEWTQYDALIDQIRKEPDTEKRAEMLQRAEDILMSTGCIVPIYYYSNSYLLKPGITGIFSTPGGIYYFMYAQKPEGKGLSIRVATEPDSLDPAFASGTDTLCLIDNLFSGLYAYDPSGKPAPACAEGYTVSEDGLQYTVRLKDGLRWSDGTALTAGDFEYAWKRAADPETGAAFATMFSVFDGYETGDINVSAADSRTLSFRLSAPCAYMEDLMAFGAFLPVQKQYVEANSDVSDPAAWCRGTSFPTNGAYTVDEWAHGEYLHYVKSPSWYDAERVSAEELSFVLSSDRAAVLAAYRAGEIDFTDRFPSDEIAVLKESPDFHHVSALGTYYSEFNVNSSLFDGKTPEQAALMRRAMTLIIDRKYIAESIGQTGQVPAGTFIPMGLSDGNGGIMHETNQCGYFDPEAVSTDREKTLEEARTLLRAAGYTFGEDGKLSKDTPISFEYLEANDYFAVAEVIQQDLAALGIELRLSSMDWSVFLEEKANGNFDMAAGGWTVDYNDPVNMLEIYTTASNNNNCQLGR